jgi:hypothetical protein
MRSVKEEGVLLRPDGVQERMCEDSTEEKSSAEALFEEIVEEFMEKEEVVKITSNNEDTPKNDSGSSPETKTSIINSSEAGYNSLDQRLIETPSSHGVVGLREDFCFRDYRKKTAQIRDTQRTIEQILYADSFRDLKSLAIRGREYAKKAVGRAVTLGDYMRQEQEQIAELRQVLLHIKSTCQQHYMEVVSFSEVCNQRIKGIVRSRPEAERRVLALLREYDKVSGSLKRLNTSNPEFYDMRTRLYTTRDAVYQGRHVINVADEASAFIDALDTKADGVRLTLLFGVHMVDNLEVKYSLVDDYLQHMTSATVFLRDFFKNAAVVYDNITQINTVLQQTTAIEQGLDTPGLMAKAYSKTLSLPQKNVTGVIDGLNTRYKEDGLRYLLGVKR